MTSRTKSKKEEEKKRQEEEAAAQAYEEFVATFEETPVQKGKVWVKAGTFDAGSRKEDTKEKGKLYKPTSKLAELAEKFSSAEKAAQYSNLRVDRDKPDKPGKKKEKEKKKKSNLELFKEELKMIQEERAERHRIKNMYQTRESGKSSRFEAAEPKIPGFLDDPKIGSFDPGDPTTTNLYLGNLSPKITEQRLMELFGRYGPLASIKIMWPRTDDERNRGRNCGFVAFMNRKDGERALSALNGKDIDGFEMKLGWGKAVPIPLHPIYIPPALVELTLPPPPSGLPFNSQPDKRDRDKVPPVGAPLPTEGEKKEEMDKILQRAVVKVVIPTERSLLQLIHRTIEFIIREGPMFEAMIMNREINNPEFRFLFENQGPAHVYYRWKLFSMLQGDSPNRWSTRPFRMFKNGSIWKPPPLNPFLQGMPEELIKMEEEEEDKNKKGSLSNAQRGRLESMIRTMTPEREKVGEAMVWCIEHADAAEEICQCLTEALTSNSTAMPKKISRLYLVSDILHNCSVKVSNASFYRKGFQAKLAEIFEGLHIAYNLVESRLRAEQVKQRIMQCCRAWEDWAIYPHEFLIHLQNLFLGLVKREPKMELEEEMMHAVVEAVQIQVDDVDGIPIDDVDGIPIKDEEKEDIDGVPISNSPLIKSAAISALLGYDDDDDEDDIDGAPLDRYTASTIHQSRLSAGGLSPTSADSRESTVLRAIMDDDDVGGVDGIPLKGAIAADNGPGPGFVSSKWESVSPKRVQAQAVTTSKWEVVEANQSEDEGADGSDSTPVYDNSGTHTQHSQNSHEDDLDGIPLVYDDYKRKTKDSSEDDSQSQDNTSDYSEDSRGFDRLQGDVSEERRARLRDVEVRVVQYQDELEQGLRSLKPGYSIHRQVAHYRHKMMRKIEREEGSERRHHRHRSRSSSPEERRPTKRSRSPHKSHHRTHSRSPSSRRHRSRSPRKRRSHTSSPPRKHKKKSRH
ncbi:U2 snRNP-associated SURP motif-containing protein-like isoform X2 [Homarus americanus]|uniref:U2 snRNP-associated SURP motif-containing protein-like isoform X2 n=1 Tax=Homarus americanus TaxID=6706 RepID=UPI001C48BFEB|nr:U2 snRNP-associated SURP motif-containing protein-like isoform X2 [Homarus americanus]